MRKLSIFSIVAAMPSLVACGTSVYTIETPADAKTGKATVLQSFEAKAPGDNNVVVLVYHGPDRPPGINPDVDSTALVDATAAEGGLGLQTVERALVPKAQTATSP
jgi:hypothetical protein